LRETTDDVQILISAARILSERRQERIVEIAQMQGAIDCINHEIGKTIHVDSRDARVDSAEVLSIRGDLFLGMRLSTAVQECLKMRREPMHSDEILHLLKAGGFATNSLASAEDLQLSKLAEKLRKNTKTFQRLPNGAFGLLVWYRDTLTGTTRHKRSKEEV